MMPMSREALIQRIAEWGLPPDTAGFDTDPARVADIIIQSGGDPRRLGGIPGEIQPDILGLLGEYTGRGMGAFLGKTGQLSAADPYAAFKAAFKAAYGRDITQHEMNNPGPDYPLNDILDGRPGLTRLLPIDRQYTLDAKVLSDLSNEDLNPILGYILNRDPKGLLNFSADRLTQFDIPSITGFYQVMSQVDPENQLTKDLAATIERVSGQAPIAPPPPQPGVPPTTPGTPPPGIAPTAPPGTPPPTGGVSAPPPAAPYAGPGQFGIPRSEQPTLPSDIASRSALEQYYAMLGYDNVARPPVTVPPPAAATERPWHKFDPVRGVITAPPGTPGFEPDREVYLYDGATAPPSAAGAAAFPDFATWRTQNPGKTYDDYFAARSAVTPPSGRTGTLADIGSEGRAAQEQADLEAGGGPPVTPSTPTTAEDWTYITPTVRERVLPDGRRVREQSKQYANGTIWETVAIEPAPKAPTGKAPLTEEEKAQAAANLQYTQAQIAALEARIKNDEAQLAIAKQAQDFNQQIAIQDRLDKTKADLQQFTLQRDQLVQRQAEFGAELTQRQAEFGATATGMIGGQPTLQREVAISQADLANKSQQAQNAVNAANIALRQGDQVEAKRQFDIAQGLRAEIERGQLALGGRAQTEAERAGEFGRGLATQQFGLTSEIERGQLALGGRAQTEAERAGEFGRGLQGAQLQFQVQRDPASFVQRAYAARGQVAPPAAVQAGMPPTATPSMIEPMARTGPVRFPGEAPAWAATPPAALEVAQPTLPEGSMRTMPIPERSPQWVGAPAVSGVAPPALRTTPPLTTAAEPGTARLSAATYAPFATTQAPLTAKEIKANVGPGLARTLEGQAPGEFFSEIPRLSAQRFSQLMPSEREEYRAAALASGTSPADLEEEIRRRSQTGTPPPAVATRTKARPRARLF